MAVKIFYLALVRQYVPLNLLPTEERHAKER